MTALPKTKSNSATQSADYVWISLLKKIVGFGTIVRPRNLSCIEIIGNQTVVDMRTPIITTIPRKLGMRFLVAEAWWILSGRSDVESIKKYSKYISQFSDNGENFFGAYGPKILYQIDGVLDAFEVDSNTRQAVINIWRENPPKSKDIPCTLSAQFLIRPDEDGIHRLHCVLSMRSSDAWLGWPYDVFNFSMLSLYLAVELRRRQMLLLLSDRDRSLMWVELGTLTLTAGSQHLYVEPKANSNLPYDINDVSALLSRPGLSNQVRDYLSPHVGEFNHGKEVVEHLGALKDFEFTTKCWMREFYEKR